MTTADLGQQLPIYKMRVTLVSHAKRVTKFAVDDSKVELHFAAALHS